MQNFIFGRFSNFFFYPNGTWTHPPTSTLFLDFWNCFNFAKPLSTVVPVVVSVCQVIIIIIIIIMAEMAVQHWYHILLNVNKCSLQISCQCCICLKCVTDLSDAILKNVEMSWFSWTGCSGSIPLLVRSFIYSIRIRIFYAVKFFNQSLTERPRKIEIARH